MRKLSGFTLNTYLGQRVSAVLEFLYQRGSAADLDDQMRTLADNDVVSMEGGFALTRFITWAIPILGFLGTVLGITTAIHGATPEVLEKSLSSVTDGLSYAFDATALALALTMITMFLSFLVERDEQGVLDAVDRTIDRCLAHRFQRSRAPTPGRSCWRCSRTREAMMEAMGRLVQKQAEVWARTVAEMDRRSEETHAKPREQFVGAVESALERTLETHAKRLAALEGKTAEQTAKLVQHMSALAAAVRDTGREQQTTLVRVAEGVAAQASVLGRLQEGESNLVHLQAVLHQNLAALASASSFEQAVHGLTAAAHLLTARTAAQSGGPVAAGPAAGEGRMRTRRHKLQVSTFPFLAVLLCAMGALLLVLLVMDRRAHDAARFRASRPSAAPSRKPAVRRKPATPLSSGNGRRPRPPGNGTARPPTRGWRARKRTCKKRSGLVRDELARAAERLRAEQDDETAIKQKIEAEHAKAGEEERALAARPGGGGRQGRPVGNVAQRTGADDRRPGPAGKELGGPQRGAEEGRKHLFRGALQRQARREPPAGLRRMRRRPGGLPPRPDSPGRAAECVGRAGRGRAPAGAGRRSGCRRRRPPRSRPT